MKIIFLEIEGVLVNQTSRNTARLLQVESVAFLPCVKALNLITDTTGATIVVTAGWRTMGLGFLTDKFKEWGITGEVVDVTPSPSISKDNAIIRWFGLAESPGSYEAGLGKVESFVIVDPEELYDSRYSPRLIRTQPEYGLTRELAETAIALLGRKL